MAHLDENGLKRLWAYVFMKTKGMAKSVSEEETLAMLMKEKIVDPVADSTGSVYTDNNGKMYTL